MFSNQVGGHSVFLKLTDCTVCKPLITPEYEFYRGLRQNLPGLVSFTPGFFGSLALTGDKAPLTGKDIVRVTLTSKDDMKKVFGDIPIVLTDPEEGSDFDRRSPRMGSIGSPATSPKIIPGGGKGSRWRPVTVVPPFSLDGDLMSLANDPETLEIESESEEPVVGGVPRRDSRASSRSSLSSRQSFRFEELDVDGMETGAEDILSRSFEEHFVSLHDFDPPGDSSEGSESESITAADGSPGQGRRRRRKRSEFSILLEVNMKYEEKGGADADGSREQRRPRLVSEEEQAVLALSPQKGSSGGSRYAVDLETISKSPAASATGDRARSFSPGREPLVSGRSLSGDGGAQPQFEVYKNKSIESSWSYRTQQKRKNSDVKQFMLLQDLSYGKEKACIMDLKMGTRQYGVGASEEKKLKHTVKSEKTTSKSMGLRMCGMQFYDTQKAVFQFISKYICRDYKPAELKQSILSFFNNRDRPDLIPMFLTRLQKLREVISAATEYRFFGCSLLLIYDASAPESEVELRMIDFANTCETSALPVDEAGPKNTPDQGYLMGLDNLIDILTNATG